MLVLLEIEDFAVVGMRSFLQNGAGEGRLAREALAQLRSYQQEKAEAAFAETERRYRMTVGVYLALAIVGLARQADGSVAQIREGTAEVIVAVNEITEVLRGGQAAATREIAQRVEGVSEGAREMSASAADSAAAAVQLEHLASELEGMAQRFRSA